MAAPKDTKPFSEDKYGQVMDRCVTDTLMKFGGGLLIGSVLSLVVFKRRSWPIIMGGGFGIGVAYTNCEKALNAN